MSNREIVLITGASSGIGFELAKEFAFHKYDLILVSRNIEKLNELADKLKKNNDIKVEIIQQDLSKKGAAKIIFDTVSEMKLQVDVLVNNAGAGSVGLFHELDIEKDLEVLQLNINSLTELTKLFSREMVKRRSGKILNVASTGAYSPGPFTAVYYATKSYVLSLSEALYMELKPYNVSVTTLCPGATKTNFAKNAGKKDMPGAMEASKVGKVAFKGLIKNKKLVVPGIQNKILIRLPKSIVSLVNFKTQKRLAAEKNK